MGRVCVFVWRSEKKGETNMCGGGLKGKSVNICLYELENQWMWGTEVMSRMRIYI